MHFHLSQIFDLGVSFFFFNAELKIAYQQFLIFLSFMSLFFKKLRSN